MLREQLEGRREEESPETEEEMNERRRRSQYLRLAQEEPAD